MKKALIAAIAGIVLSVVSSYADGYIFFQNFDYDGTNQVASAVTITNGGDYASEAGGFSADLLYSLNGGITYSLAPSSQTSFFPGSTPTGSPEVEFSGLFFLSPEVVIPGYTSGSVYFIVRVYNGATYASSTLAGQSAPFVISSLPTNVLTPPGNIMALSGSTATGLQPFYLYP